MCNSPGEYTVHFTLKIQMIYFLSTFLKFIIPLLLPY